jgi:hypothetical protein
VTGRGAPRNRQEHRTAAGRLEPVRPFVLPDALARELCDRLSAPWPSTFADVELLYRRWCACIPFDTIAKALAIEHGRPLPGADATEVVETWLGTGVGGTCWGQVNAFAALLGAAGIAASAGLDRMLLADGEVDFHSVAVVSDGAVDHICDFTHASQRPLPLVAGARGAQGPYEVGIDDDGGGRLVHWYRNPGHETTSADDAVTDPRTRYILLSTVLDAADVAAFGVVAGAFSGVQARKLYSRRFPDGGYTYGRPTDDGAALTLTTYAGSEATARVVTDVDEALDALGYNEEGRRMAERAGLLHTGADGVTRYRV